VTALRVGAAFPDPPFNGALAGVRDSGLDVDLMGEIAHALGLDAEFVPYQGPDFNRISDALNSGAYDCVASGTTVAQHRQRRAAFGTPYLESGQSLAVDVTRLPHVRSIDDLEGLTIGVQQGNTSQPIADSLVARGRAARVRVYDYGSIRAALTDLTTGGCDVFMKLAPVLTALVQPVTGVEVVSTGISHEGIAIAVPVSDPGLGSRIGAAQSALEAAGRLGEIRRRWLGSSRLDQSH
jgi:polar amino acid transport system substrate-binding protein